MKSVFQIVSGVVFAFALLVTLSAVSVFADGPTSTPEESQTPGQDFPVVVTGAVRNAPAAAGTFGITMDSIPAHTAQWFRFNYDTGGYQVPRPTVTIRLLNGVSSGLGFEVWSPDRLQGNWSENKPIGRGTQQVLPLCSEAQVKERQPVEGNPPSEENLPGEENLPVQGLRAVEGGQGINVTPVSSTFVECGKLVTNDLTWTGGFGAGGTYYVRLVNPTNAPIIPQLLIGGAGLQECVSANLGLPALGHVPSPDEAFVQVQCQDVGPGLVAGEGEVSQQGED